MILSFLNSTVTEIFNGFYLLQVATAGSQTLSLPIKSSVSFARQSWRGLLKTSTWSLSLGWVGCLGCLGFGQGQFVICWLPWSYQQVPWDLFRPPQGCWTSIGHQQPLTSNILFCSIRRKITWRSSCIMFKSSISKTHTHTHKHTQYTWSIV